MKKILLDGALKILMVFICAFGVRILAETTEGTILYGFVIALSHVLEPILQFVVMAIGVLMLIKCAWWCVKEAFSSK